MSKLRLTSRQRVRLEQQLRKTKNARNFRRTLAVLEAARGRSIAEIARMLRTSRVSVHRWIAHYLEGGAGMLLRDQRGGNHPSFWTDHEEALLRASLDHRPDDFGYPAVEWTVPLLQKAFDLLSGHHAIGDHAAAPIAPHGLCLEATALPVASGPAAREKNDSCASGCGTCRGVRWYSSRTKRICCCFRRCEAVGVAWQVRLGAAERS
jgi:transposase